MTLIQYPSWKQTYEKGKRVVRVQSLLDPILLTVTNECWSEHKDVYQSLMGDFLRFLIDLETLEALFESRNKLLRILATLEFWNIVKAHNPFLNYPECPRHYQNLFRNHILPLLVRRSDYITNDLVNSDFSLDNQYVPEEMISCCDILHKYLFQKCSRYSCISTNTDLKSDFLTNHTICVTYIEGNNDRFVNFFQCYNLNAILNDDLNINEYARALKVAAAIYAIQTERLVDPFEIRPFSRIYFDEDFMNGLFNEAKFFLKSSIYKNEVIRAISCAIYDINDSTTHLHLLDSSDRLYSGYVFKHAKSAPDGKCSRIVVKYENGSVFFRGYIPDFH